MKQNLLNIKKLACLVALVTTFAACNKSDITTKAVSIQIGGYNVGNSELQVTIDTVVYNKFNTGPDKLLNFRNVYTYPSTQGQAILKIKDLISGKEVYQTSLTLGSKDLERFFPFVFLNGSPLEIKAPAADPATNKMAFYIYYPQSDDALDVYMKNKENEIVYIAKNVKPGTWAYSEYNTTTGFTNLSETYTWYFVKAGTTDQWAFNDSEWMSQYATGTLSIPKKGEKGRVQTYFVTPSTNQLDVASLFKQVNY